MVALERRAGKVEMEGDRGGGRGVSRFASSWKVESGKVETTDTPRHLRPPSPLVPRPLFPPLSHHPAQLLSRHVWVLELHGVSLTGG